MSAYSTNNICTAASNVADSEALGGQLREICVCQKRPVNNGHQIVMGSVSLAVGTTPSGSDMKP